MQPRLCQSQSAVLLPHLIPFSIHRAERKGEFPVLELGRVEIVLGFEVRRQETMSASRRRGRRAEEVTGEEEDGENEGEYDPDTVCDTEVASA